MNFILQQVDTEFNQAAHHLLLCGVFQAIRYSQEHLAWAACMKDNKNLVRTLQYIVDQSYHIANQIDLSAERQGNIVKHNSLQDQTNSEKHTWRTWVFYSCMAIVSWLTG
jgi:hypothetical protein